MKGNRTWMNNPKNIWGVWVNSSIWQKILTALCLVGLLWLMPLMEMFQNINQLNQLEQETQQQNEQVIQQQRLVAALKAQLQQTPTPELARRISDINQDIQALAEQLQLEQSQWSFSQQPTIKLQIRGHFFPLCDFVTALLQKGQLQVIQWHITRLDDEEQDEEQSIHSQLILQLKKD